MVDIRKSITAHLDMIQSLEGIIPEIEAAAETMVTAIRAGGKILWMGNGGSAADAQHMAAEIVGRYNRDRKGLPSIALTTDTSILTSVANDFGYETVFARQIEALCRRGDVVIGISTSGNSPNVIAGLDQAKTMGATTIGLTGGDGGQLREHCDLALIVSAADTARIQEGHGLIGHMLCDWVEAAFSS